MKLGIITRYTRDTINFGNVLQTYALNYYIRDNFPEYDTETIVLSDDYNIGKVKTSYIVAFVRKLYGLFQKKRASIKLTPVKGRQDKFQKFANEHIALSEVLNSEGELADKKFDYLVVGSDVVWAQIHNNYNRIKFLCFDDSEGIVKVSYAASFGRDYIPYENRRKIKKALLDFKGISVREKSSIELLKEIGIDGVVHVADPTLLLSVEHWKEIEEKITLDIDTGYIMIMLLNAETWQIERIKEISNRLGCKTILVTNGYQEDVLSNGNMYDLILDAISPSEWLWLIDNSQLVITDSFHCMIFSIIFQRHFFVLERAYDSDINNRMIDFLRGIDCMDKFINKEIDFQYNQFSWDYTEINNKVRRLTEFSKSYLQSMLVSGANE